MKVGMIGLGRMGANMTQRLLQSGHGVVAHDRNPQAVKESASAGAIGAASPAELVSKLTDRPRVIWLMVPSGPPTDAAIDELLTLLDAGDILIDGGNTNYKEGLAAYERCKRK